MEKKNQIKITSLIIAALFAVIAPCAIYAAEAQLPPAMPLEKQEKVQQLHNQIRALEFLRTVVDADSMKKKGQCMQAIGSKSFCDCVIDNSPSGINFVDYVALVAATKEELKYEALPESDKGMVDKARLARDKCVNWNGKLTN